MRKLLLTLIAIPVAAIAGVAIAGQSVPAVKKATPGPTIKRTPDGHPDLQGMYDLATLTPMERPAGAKAVLTQAEADALEKRVATRNAAGDLPIKGDREAPPVGGDGSTGAYGNVGGYNSFWLDAGTSYTLVNGERRTSLIIDPPDGRVPPLTAEARSRAASRIVRPTSDASESRDPGLEPAGSYDDPERRPLGERCILGFGSTSGPPALPNYFYNNLHQIVQTPSTVMILTEMVHDARIVRIGGEHLPKTIRKWMGDSIGKWDGDTLVVDTTNFTDKTRFRGSSENLHVVERFSRVDANTLLYRFTIDDPSTWTKPWTGEFTWPATSDLMYEYACHEANYSMGNILRGARVREAEEAAKKPKPRNER
jgi:hypothetical protein